MVTNGIREHRNRRSFVLIKNVVALIGTYREVRNEGRRGKGDEEVTNKSFFLTATGILVAILLVWASLWTTTGQWYIEADKDANLTTVSWGLIVVFWALLASLFAFVITICKSVNRLVLALLFYSLTLTICEVLGSLIPSIIKTLAPYKNLNQPLFNITPPIWLNAFIVIGIPLIIFLIWYGLAFWCKCKKINKLFDNFLKIKD